MLLVEIKICCEGSFITQEILHFYISVLNIEASKVVGISRMR
jgi:hypothetical protein